MKGAQINPKGEQSAGWCGARSGAGAVGPLGADAGRGSRRRTVLPAPSAPHPDPERRPKSGSPVPHGMEKRERRPSAARPAVAPGRGGSGTRRGRRGASRRHLKQLEYAGRAGRRSPERSGGRVVSEGLASPPPSLGPRGAERRQEERTRAGQRRASAPVGIVCGRRPLPRAARPSPSPAAARAFVHTRPAHRRSACGTDDGDADTHRPAAEGRVLLIHFPLALARPGRRGRGPAGGNGRSAPGTVRVAPLLHRAPGPRRPRGTKGALPSPTPEGQEDRPKDRRPAAAP